MSVVEARIIDRSDDGAVVQFTIEAKNSNDKPMPLREARYSLELDGRSVFTGARSAETTLPKSRTQRFVLPAAVPASLVSSIGSGARYRLVGTQTYVTPGAFAELLFDTGVSRPSVGFSAQGTIDEGGAVGTAPNTPVSTIGAAGK